MTVGVVLRIAGRVQGVGFRPTVFRLARDLGLAGDVRNDSDGVVVRLFGPDDSIAGFEAALRRHLPPLAAIERIAREPWHMEAPPSEFVILDSAVSGHVGTGIVPDAATCPACLADIRDPSNRRYRYPFTNCTHCGPRFSIVRAVPFDRARTTMAGFTMCPACRAEYDDPGDRRHHTQANACPACGPRVWLEAKGGDEIEPADGDAIAEAARRIAAGEIVAIKGVGGFHLACNATDAEAVARLRARKRRFDKPFALMAGDGPMIERFANVVEHQQTMLADASAPIVLLRLRPDGEALAGEVAPGRDRLGFMLPYTPLHHLLMADLTAPIVLTSGNLSDEPQVTDNEDARGRLAGLADAWLMHDRDIATRVDDSVVLVEAGGPSVVRRGRGLAPESFPLPPGFATTGEVLAMGAELKNTFAFATAGRTTVSHHIGDLGDAAAFADYRRAIDHYMTLFDIDPTAIAVDLHPDYGASRWGAQLAARTGLPVVGVQHHHAHVAACLTEHGRPLDAPPVLGVVLDGLGLGDDGALWGAEILRADYRGFIRLASFPAMPLIGGDRAAREPWRNAFAWLDGVFGWEAAAARWPDLPVMRALQTRRPEVLRRMVERGVNAPMAVSAGRLFDAVAAVLGVAPDAQSYEGQAAMDLEVMARRGDAGTAIYPLDLVDGAPTTLDFTAFWTALMDDVGGGAPVADIATRFHVSLGAGIADAATRLAGDHGLDTVVLSGGVFQNLLLKGDVGRRLTDAGLQVLTPQAFPAHDGGIALGQTAVARARGFDQSAL